MKNIQSYFTDSKEKYQKIQLTNDKLNVMEVDLLKLETNFSQDTYSSLKKGCKAIQAQELPSQFMLSRADSLTKRLDSITERLPNSIKEEFDNAGSSITMAKMHSWFEKIKEKSLELGTNISISDELRNLTTGLIAFRKDFFSKQDINELQISCQGQEKMERIYGDSQPKSFSRTSLDEEVELDTTFEYNLQEDSEPEMNNSNDDLESGYDSSSDCDEDRLSLQYLKGYQTQSALYDKKICPHQLLGVTQYDNSVPTEVLTKV